MSVDIDPDEAMDAIYDDPSIWLELLDDAIADYIEDVVGGDYE